jgi:hypothetical protein
MSSDKEILEAANESTDFDHRVAEILHQRHKTRWRALTVWITVFSFVVIISYRQTQNLVEQNQERITDIQTSRVLSCKANYEGIRQVAISLYPPRKIRSVQQAESLSNLNETIKKLKLKCAKQVRTK